MPGPKTHDPSRLKKAFLDAYRTTGNITRAAAIAGMDRRTHYDWLAADPEGYGAEFHHATEEAVDMLEQEARRRALEGVEEPVGWYQGMPGGHVQKYSDTLLIFLLKGARPERYRERYEVTGKDGGPVQFQEVTDAELYAQARALASRFATSANGNGNGKR